MKTILVPVDLSTATARVCSTACELAHSLGGRMVLLYVLPPPPAMMHDYYAFDAGGIGEIMANVEKDSWRRLQRVARRYQEGGYNVEPVIETGQSGPTIVAQAKALRADYIVLGSHGHGAVFDLLVGSTTHTVLRKAKCPVLVVPISKR